MLQLGKVTMRKTNSFRTVTLMLKTSEKQITSLWKVILLSDCEKELLFNRQLGEKIWMLPCSVELDVKMEISKMIILIKTIHQWILDKIPRNYYKYCKLLTIMYRI